jgi:hypothetical protein
MSSTLASNHGIVIIEQRVQRTRIVVTSTE